MWYRALAEKACSLPTMNTVDAREVLVGFYETEFGIFDHYNAENAANHPIASVELHAAEEYREESARYVMMTAFAEKKIGAHFNISWFDFIKQPREECRMMMDVSDRKNDKDAKLQQEAAAEAEKRLQTLRASQEKMGRN